MNLSFSLHRRTSSFFFIKKFILSFSDASREYWESRREGRIYFWEILIYFGRRKNKIKIFNKKNKLLALESFFSSLKVFFCAKCEKSKIFLLGINSEGAERRKTFHFIFLPFDDKIIAREKYENHSWKGLEKDFSEKANHSPAS